MNFNLRSTKKLLGIQIIALSIVLLVVYFLNQQRSTTGHSSRATNNRADIESDLTRSRNDVIAVPYAMNDYENCNPKTLKSSIDQTKDCFSQWGTLPSNRPDYYLGSFGMFQPIMWKEIQVGPDQYNWTKFDKILQDASNMQIRDMSGNTLKYKPVIFAFGTFLQTDGNPHDGKKDMIDYTPDFVRQKVGVDQFVTRIEGCDEQDISPWHNQTWRNHYKQFIDAVATHLKNSSFLYVVQAIAMSGGLSDETTATKNLADCMYKTQYMEHYGEEYNRFMTEQLYWYSEAFRVPNSSKYIKPIYLQAAAASSNLRVWYEEEARKLGIGLKMNSLQPGNQNAYNTKTAYAAGGKGALYDFVDMLNLTIPIAFEPQYPHDHATDEFCSSQYCSQTEAGYQLTYWTLLTGLSHKADFIDLQKVHFFRKAQMPAKFDLAWLDELMELSFGKTPNQSRTAWIAFAQQFVDKEAYPNKPNAPLLPGQGDYFRYEFAERGDREFYLYRVEETEDSSLIRSNGGFLPDGKETYAVKTNSCAKNIAHSQSKFYTGSQLREAFLDSSQLNHPFSTGARGTDKGSGNYHISLQVERATRLQNASSLDLSIYYLDTGTGSFAVDFFDKAGVMQSKVIQKTATKKWKEYTLHLEKDQFSFTGLLPGGADIRLNCLCDEQTNASGDDDIFHMVKLIARDKTIAEKEPKTQQFFCQGEPFVPSPQPTVTTPVSPSPTNTPVPTPILSPTEAPTPTVSPTQTSSIARISPHLNLTLALRGASSYGLVQEHKAKVKVKLLRANEVIADKQVEFIQNQNGSWSGTVTFENIIPSSDYSLQIKGEKHIGRILCEEKPVEKEGKYQCVKGSIPLTQQKEYTFDFSRVVQIPGDLPQQDGVVDSRDAAQVRFSLGKQDSDAQAKADLNYDGIVDSQDFSLMLQAFAEKKDD